MATNPVYATMEKASSLLPCVILSLLVISCDNGVLTSVALDSKQDLSQYKKRMSIQRQQVGPMQVYCANGRYLVFRNIWEDQNQFRSMAGKFIGVMDNDMPRNQNYVTQYGCSMVEVSSAGLIGQLHSYGYSVDSIIIGLGEIGWQQTVDAAVSQGVRRFYIDEPIQNNIQQTVRDAAPYIASRGGSLIVSESEFNWTNWYVLKGRGNIGAMVDLALSVSPSPFVCCHTHFEYHSLGVTQVTLDPRDQWDYIVSRVPNLFKMVIVKSRQTPGEMDLLFWHANDLGLNQILLYPFQEDGITYAGVQSAIWEGWYYHWVQQFEKEVRQQWCCLDIFWDPGECSFKSQSYTGQTRWY